MKGFEEFYRSEAQPLLRLCWLATLDRDAAADAADETLARAWAHWDRISGAGSDPAAWARTVALNLCRSRWRRLRREWRPYPALGAGTTAGAVSDPDLLDCLRRLPQRQREAVALRYWLDLPLAGVADAMGVSVGTVKQHLARAHERLSKELEPEQLGGLLP